MSTAGDIASSHPQVGGERSGSALAGETLSIMHPGIRRLLETSGGIVDRQQVLAVVPHHVLDHAVARGHLVRIFPRTYVEAQNATNAQLRRRAALRYAGGRAALSHATALAGWQLPVPEQASINITTGTDCQLRGAPGVRAHRRDGFRVEPPWTVVRDGLAHVRLERALVESWPRLPAPDRRAPLIVAVQRRLTTADRVRAEARGLPRLKDRSQLLALATLLQDGCHSELEIWGHEHVFTSPLLPPARRQRAVSLGSRTVYLDVAYQDELVAIELDGSAFHPDRERDRRRDHALAARGWLTLRFSHARLQAEPEAVRREVLATLAVRRQQLRCG